MNSAQWHLLLNHFPIVGVIIGLLILITSLLLKSLPIKQIALGVFVLSALVGIPAFLTGEGAEEIIEKMGVSSEIVVENHEESAKLFLILLEILGALSLFKLFIKLKTKNNLFFSVITIIIAVFTCVAGIQAGATGGKVRHTELNSSDNSQTSVVPNAVQEFEY